LIAADCASVRKGDANGRSRVAAIRLADVARAEVEKLGEFPRILGGRNSSGGLFHERVQPISLKPASSYLDRVELLAKHRFDGVSPELDNGGAADLR